MAQTISPSQLTAEIMEVLNDFKGQTMESVKKAANDGAKEALNALHNAHPSGAEKYGSWDAYNKDWAILSKTPKPTSVEVVVYNRKHYRLTHLLEKGHALRDGGRSRAFEHIAPAEAEAEKVFMEKVRQGI